MSKIIDRVRKLLELSHSTNEHEAVTAATRAAELMSQHAISSAMLEVASADDASQSEAGENVGLNTSTKRLGS